MKAGEKRNTGTKLKHDRRQKEKRKTARCGKRNTRRKEER
jgi:hypothetical protein